MNKTKAPAMASANSVSVPAAVSAVTAATATTSNEQHAASDTQAMLDLSTDLTGLLISSTYVEAEGQAFECLLSDVRGRRRDLAFKLVLHPRDEYGQQSVSYLPKIDKERDKEIDALLEDHFKTLMRFDRSQACFIHLSMLCAHYLIVFAFFICRLDASLGKLGLLFANERTKPRRCCSTGVWVPFISKQAWHNRSQCFRVQTASRTSLECFLGTNAICAAPATETFEGVFGTELNCYSAQTEREAVRRSGVRIDHSCVPDARSSLCFCSTLRRAKRGTVCRWGG